MKLPIFTRWLLAALALSCPSAKAGLIGYWNFDDSSLNDLSGRGNNALLPAAGGAPSGTATTPTFDTPPTTGNLIQPFGVRAGATTAKFLNCNVGTGAALWVQNPTPTDLFNFPAGRYSISFFTRLPWALGSSGVSIVAKGGETFNASPQGWQVQRSVTTSDPGFVTRGFGSNTGSMQATAANWGSGNSGIDKMSLWQHIAVVCDGANKHIYINGYHCRTEAVTTGSLTSTSSKLTFGARHNAATGVWEGHSKALLDEIAIFDHALTSAEIEDLSRGADPRYGLRTTTRPFWFGNTAAAPTPAQGGAGYIGVRETFLSGGLLAGTTYSAIAIPSDAILYARTAVGTTQSRDGTANPLVTAIDFQDPDNGGTGANGTAANFFTNAAGDQNQFYQFAQGAFQVNTPGTYSFLFKGNDSMVFSILGVNWDRLNANNGTGVLSGETISNGQSSTDIGMIGVITLPAGTYNWRYLYTEGTGAAWNEVLYAPGDKFSYDASFVQLGTSSGGLALVDHKPMMDLRSDAQFITGGLPANIRLTWDAAYATTVTLNGGAFSNQNVTASTIKGLGSITTPSPATTTTYTISGVRGAQTVTKTFTVFVNAPPAVNSFTVDDPTALAGQPMAFRWNVAGQGAGANSVTISDGTTTTDLTSLTDVAGSGVITTLVAPSSTAVYTLTATNAAGSTTAQVTVTVGQPPTITFTPSDGVIEPDTSVTLNYNVPGATAVSISPNFSSAPTPAPSGSIIERVQAQTTYTLTATNPFGTSTATVTILIHSSQDLGVTQAGWTLTLYKSTGAVNTLADSQALIDGTVARGNVTVGAASVPTPIALTNQPMVNLTDGTGDGAIPGGSWPTASWGTAAIEDFVVRATATLVVAGTAEYTLNINNDDGGRLRIDLNNDGDFNDAGETIINDDTLHGTTTFSAAKVLSVGTYPIEYIYFERGGGAAGETFYTNAAAQNLGFTVVSGSLPISFPDLHITEIMASNSRTVKDGQGSYEDYIEIYNGTGAPRSLAGYYLTDDPLVPNKWAFPTAPAHNMGSGEYLLVFASSKNITLAGDEYHTNFKLDPDGEYLALTKDNGAGGFTVVQAFNPFPAQNNDISWGEYDTEHYVGFFANPTPGRRNTGGYEGYVLGETKVVVTQGATLLHNRGFYTAPITATLTKEDPNAIIKYTTDGSTPSQLVGTTYTTPLTISNTTVLRSIALRPNFIQSDIDTHTFIFTADVINQTPTNATDKGWPAAAVNGQGFDYGMSTSVVSGNQPAIQAALQAIPTISIVTDIGNLVNAQAGIYVNPGGRGRAWERPASIELINDLGDGKGNFQIDMGLRIRGGFSRSTGNPKHAWHFYFRPEYDGDLNYAMYGLAGPSDFEQLDFQCPQNYSWSFSPQNSTYNFTNPAGSAASVRLRFNTFVREPVSRDLYGAMGNVTPKTRHYHCYVNGQYWGIYMTQERAEASFGETYFGGDKNTFDVVKSAGNAAGYNTEVTDGTFDQGTSATPGSAWAKLWWRTNEIRSNAGMTETSRRTMYYELMGLDANGAPYNDPVNHPVVLDPAGLIDYMLITWYCGSFDAPLSTFLGGASNNWFGMRDRNGTRGFHFIPHDFEHGMGADLNTGAGANDTRSTDRTGPWGGNGVNYKGFTMVNQLTNYLKSNPAYIHENLCAVTEYRQLFADRAYMHLARPGGALTEPKVLATIDAKAAGVRPAIFGESARWGDAKGVGPTDFLPAPWDEGITQLKDWVRQGSNAEYIASIPTQANPTGTQGLGRHGRIIAQLRAYQDKVNNADATFQPLPLYSVLDAPVLSNLGGVVASGTTMTITNPNGATGTLYWSKNGTDPRLAGGGINPSASVVTGASPATITLTATGTVVARVYNSATQVWSGVAFADFIVGTPASAANLVITEINYNPLIGAPGTLPPGENEQVYEFIELMNLSGGPIDLTDVAFTNGITYPFPSGRILAAGERIVVVRDLAAFASRYPDSLYPGLSTKTVGPWIGALDSGGEILQLVNYAGADIANFRYDDDLPWPAGPDGNGPSAVFTTSSPTSADKGNGNNWTAHGLTHGNPGGPDITGYAAWAPGNGASGNGTGDGDGDGLTDLMEYFLGGSTALPSVSKLPVSGRAAYAVNLATADYQTLTFNRAAGTGDVQVVCETRASLTALDWAADAVLVSRTTNVDGSEAYKFRAPTPISAGTSQFMRIKVTLP